MGDATEREAKSWWTTKRALRARALVAGLLCLAGVVIYALVVERKYPIEDWLFWRLGSLWGYGLLFTCGCVGVGHLVLHRLLKVRDLPVAETLLMSMGIGLLGLCLCVYAVGTVGVIGPVFAVATMVAFLALGTLHARDLLAKAVEGWRTRPRHGLLPGLLTGAVFGWGAICICFLYLQAMTPAAINYDASWYHMPVAEDYARTGKLIPFYADYNRTFPQLTTMVHTWAFSVPGLIPQLRWMLALQNEFIIVCWKIVGVVAAAQWMLQGHRVRSLWVAFFLFPSIYVLDQNIGGSADHFMGFWAVPMMLATARLLERFDRRYALLLAIMSAGAVLTKLQAVYMVVACGTVIGARFFQLAYRLVRTPQKATVSWRDLLAAPGLVIGVGLLLASPHFIKNVVFYGNPVYPFAQEVFTTSYPVHEKSAFFFAKAYPNYPYLPKGTRVEKMIEAVRLFFTFSFEPHYSFTKRFPSMGSLFTLLLPCVLLVEKPRRIWLGIVIAFLGIFVWGNTYLGDRYLQAILPVAIAVAAALLVRVWQLGWLARVGLVPLVAFQMVWGGDVMFYEGHKRLQAAVDLIRSGYEGKRTDEDRFDYRPRQLEINADLPEDARILARNYRSTVGIDREILSDVQAWQAYIFYEPVKGPRDLYELYASRGITHLLFPPGRRPSGTLQAVTMFAELVYRYGVNRKDYGHLSVVEMPESPPPAETSEYRVLTLDMSGYEDGMYVVEQLHVYDRVPRRLREKVEPEEWLLARNGAADMLERVDAVVRKRRSKLDKSAQKILGRDFAVAEKFKKFTVYVRKDRSTRKD